MSPDDRFRSRSRWRQSLPADSAAVIVLTILADLFIFLPVINETPLRVLLVVPLVLFLPGYAFISILFPEKESSSEGVTADESMSGRGILSGQSINSTERVLLSIGVSAVLVPLLGLIINVSPASINMVTVALTVSGFTIFAAVVGASRRQALPEEEQFTVPYRRWLAQGRSSVFKPSSKVDLVLNVVVVLSALLLISSMAYGVMVPTEDFTEFSLLTKNESGSFTASGYPTEFSSGESKPLYISVENNGEEQTNYTVIVKQQQVSTVNNTTTMQAETELQRLRFTVEAGETRRVRHTVTPRLSGQEFRLVYLLYKGDPPANPTTKNAYRELHLWINVSDSRSSITRPSLQETASP